MCLNDPKASREYSSTMNFIYNNINDGNLYKKREFFIVLDDMNTDLDTNKKFQAII